MKGVLVTIVNAILYKAKHWIYHKGINETKWWRSGGKRLIHFKKYIIPVIG